MKATMRLSILLTMAVVLTAVSCGGGRHLGQPGKLFPSASSVHQARFDPGFTEEDYRLMEMSYEERLAYLEQRYKELVYEFHGALVDDTLLGSKSASDYAPPTATEAQAVQKLAAYYDVRENLYFSWDDETRTWVLKFYERLCGDLSLDSKVSIADITPLAVHFGCKLVEDEHGIWRWEPPDPMAPHIDRNSNSDGTPHITYCRFDNWDDGPKEVVLVNYD